MDEVDTRAIGWYGKLPWVGDFVGHGLPWQRLWDGWLQRGLAAAEGALGAAALRVRVQGLAAWQLLLPAPERDGLGWCGIVAGSRDRVGRAFPVLIAEGVPQAVLDGLPLVRLQARMLALSDWLWDASGYESMEEFEAGVAAWSEREWPQVTQSPGGATVTDRIADLRRAQPGAASFWWRTEPVPDVRQPLAEPWPPSETLLLRMLGGDAHLEG